MVNNKINLMISGAVVSILLLILATVISMRTVRQEEDREALAAITSVLETTVQAVKSWRGQHIKAVDLWAGDDAVIQAVSLFDPFETDREMLLTHPAQKIV